MERSQILDWAVELQSLAQAGLFYGKDVYDIERFTRIREIAAEMVSQISDVSLEKVTELFCCETGYQTPKLDTRAAIFQGDKILLVQETNGLWSLPGGWADVNLSIGENAVKEVREEAGLEVTIDRVIALQDRNKHNQPPYAFGICKVFFLCTVLGGSFVPNIETTASGYFPLDDLPPLCRDKCTEKQIRLCFQAKDDPNWKTLVE